VPRTREALEALPGVGRKTANVVLNVAFGEPTMAVDTHIFRVANRTGLAPGATRWRSSGLLRARAAGLPGRRAPLADPAWPLRVPGAQAAVRRCAVRRWCDHGRTYNRPDERRHDARPTCGAAMRTGSDLPMTKLHDLAERVDRLVLRHEELKRTSQLMEQQLQAVTAERDSLKSRLAAARGRIDALLARLPADGSTTEARP
jgi:cell division protein ZapB